MENQNQSSIDALNELIEINNDRVEGYKTASDETDSSELKSLFHELESTSQQLLSELRAEVTKLGGEPEQGTRVTGKIFRGWMDLKAALTGKDKHAILASCEFGEDKAQEAYEHVLEEHTDVLTSDQLDLVHRQQSTLRKDHDRVKALRDAAQ